VKTLGDPQSRNAELIYRINQIKLSPVLGEDELRVKFVEMLSNSSVVLDCGKSLREQFVKAQAVAKRVETIDINRFENYPDYLADICDSKSMKYFRGNYDFIVAFSLIEHCHDPISATRNLFSALKKGGKIVGSAPFLFPRHGPEDLSYQDFFRFTRDSYAILFPDASNIELFPLRGRVATALNVLTLRYRFSFERRFTRLSSALNRLASSGPQQFQASGYGFIVSN